MSAVLTEDIKLVYDLFSQIAPISPENIESILPYLQKAKYKKEDKILEPGQIDDRINLVTKGIVHLYTYIDGELFTINILLPGMIFNSLDSYIYQRPSIEIQQAITDVDIIYLNKQDADSLMLSNNTFCYIYAKLFEFQLSERERRTLLLQYKSAFKRFELFINSISNAQRYLQEVPQKLLAQFLGLAPETFCRAKSQFFRRKPDCND